MLLIVSEWAIEAQPWGLYLVSRSFLSGTVPLLLPGPHEQSSFVPLHPFTLTCPPWKQLAMD